MCSENSERHIIYQKCKNIIIMTASGDAVVSSVTYMLSMIALSVADGLIAFSANSSFGWK